MTNLTPFAPPQIPEFPKQTWAAPDPELKAFDERSFGARLVEVLPQQYIRQVSAELEKANTAYNEFERVVSESFKTPEECETMRAKRADELLAIFRSNIMGNKETGENGKRSVFDDEVKDKSRQIDDDNFANDQNSSKKQKREILVESILKTSLNDTFIEVGIDIEREAADVIKSNFVPFESDPELLKRVLAIKKGAIRKIWGAEGKDGLGAVLKELQELKTGRIDKGGNLVLRLEGINSKKIDVIKDLLNKATEIIKAATEEAKVPNSGTFIDQVARGTFKGIDEGSLLPKLLVELTEKFIGTVHSKFFDDANIASILVQKIEPAMLKDHEYLLDAHSNANKAVGEKNETQANAIVSSKVTELILAGSKSGKVAELSAIVGEFLDRHGDPMLIDVALGVVKGLDDPSEVERVVRGLLAPKAN